MRLYRFVTGPRRDEVAAAAAAAKTRIGVGSVYTPVRKRAEHRATLVVGSAISRATLILLNLAGAWVGHHSIGLNLDAARPGS